MTDGLVEGAVVALACAAALLLLPGGRVGAARLRGHGRPPRRTPPRRVVAGTRGRAEGARASEQQLQLAAGLAERLAALLAAGVGPAAAWLHAARTAGLPPGTEEALSRAVARGAPVGPLLRAAGGPGTGQVAAAWALAQRTGAPAAEVLTRSATALREAADARAGIRSALAGPRASARTVAALPLLGLLLGAGLGASPWTVLLGTWPGRACAVAGLALALAGHCWSRHLVHRASGPCSGAPRGRAR